MRMPEMVSPRVSRVGRYLVYLSYSGLTYSYIGTFIRSLVFRPLVKGNKDSGNEIASIVATLRLRSKENKSNNHKSKIS